MSVEYNIIWNFYTQKRTVNADLRIGQGPGMVDGRQ
jgi:hypothetical protein